MIEHDRQIIHSSEESDWRTPPECFQALNREFPFGWDLAADARSTLLTADSSGLSARYLGPGSHYGEDALAVTWAALTYPHGFLNPPFSRKKAREWVGSSSNPYHIATWAKKCWEESQRGCTIVGLFPFAPQTEWYRQYVYGHTEDFRGWSGQGWSGHAAKEERRLPHRISFLRPDGSPAGNAGVNTAVIVWGPMTGAVGPWMPHSYYWSYR